MRHGLNLPLTQGVANSEIDALARRLSGADPAKLEAARTAAEAQLDLRRIRGAKDSVLMQAIDNYNASSETTPDPLAPDDRVSICLPDVARQLLTLEGYERKALSRRKKALRAIYF